MVVLRDPVRAAHRAGLDLTAIGRHGNVGDRAILGLTGTVAQHSGVGIFLGHLDGVEGLGERADLVDLYQDRVCHALGDALGKELGVGDEEVVANKLGGFAELVGDHLPAGPIVFGAAVFDRDDRVLFLQLRVVGHKFFGALHRLVGLLEDIGFLLLIEEFRARDIESNRDVVAHLVASLFDRLANNAKRVIGAL